MRLTFCLAAIASSEAGGALKFNDACKLLVLNNIDGLTSRMVIELFTSEKLKRNTHTICTGVRMCVCVCVQKPPEAMFNKGVKM